MMCVLSYECLLCFSPPPPIHFQCDGVEVRLDDHEATLFYYIHKLWQQRTKSEPLRRAWDLTYSLVYQEGQGGAEELPQVGGRGEEGRGGEGKGREGRLYGSL